MDVHLPHRYPQHKPVVQKPSAASRAGTVCIRIGCMLVFGSALDSNLETMKGNLGGLKQEEKKRRGDQSMHSDVHRNKAEALMNQAFTF